MHRVTASTECSGKECMKPANVLSVQKNIQRCLLQIETLEEETLRIKYREKRSYKEAKEKATKKPITAGVIYTSIAQKERLIRDLIRNLKTNEKENGVTLFQGDC